MIYVHTKTKQFNVGWDQGIVANVMRWIFSFVFAICFFVVAPKAWASEAVVDVISAGEASVQLDLSDTKKPTHPDIYLTPDKSELVRLETDASSIIIGNPTHVSVLADNARTLVFIPQVPGATYVTILDKDSRVIMQRHVIVAAPKDQYVRIRKSCAASESETCQETNVYYCPDACHEIGVMAEQLDNAGGAGGASSETEGGAGDAGAAEEQE